MSFLFLAHLFVYRAYVLLYNHMYFDVFMLLIAQQTVFNCPVQYNKGRCFKISKRTEGHNSCISLATSLLTIYWQGVKANRVGKCLINCLSFVRLFPCVCSLRVWDPWHWQKELSVNMTWSEWCTAASTLRGRPSRLRTGNALDPAAGTREGEAAQKV